MSRCRSKTRDTYRIKGPLKILGNCFCRQCFPNTWRTTGTELSEYGQIYRRTTLLQEDVNTLSFPDDDIVISRFMCRPNTSFSERSHDLLVSLRNG